MEEHWNPATAAVEDVDDAMLDEMLRHMEELDEHLKQSEADEVIKDATLKKLELVTADQGRGERSVFLDMEEVNKKTITWKIFSPVAKQFERIEIHAHYKNECGRIYLRDKTC